MPTRYRCLFLAVGFFLISATQQTKQDVGESAREERVKSSSISLAVKPEKQAYRPYAKYNPDPCYLSADHDAADLCAQWRAAVAAEKAAHEARRATNWAIAATLLTFMAVIGLIVSLWQTRGALGEARRGNRITLQAEKRARRESRHAVDAQERALSIAGKQLEIAEKSSKAQIRSYLTVDRVEPFQTVGKILSAKIFIKNVGQTPAKISNISARIWISEKPTLDPIEDGPDQKKFYHFRKYLSNGDMEDILTFTDDLEFIEN